MERVRIFCCHSYSPIFLENIYLSLVDAWHLSLFKLSFLIKEQKNNVHPLVYKLVQIHSRNLYRVLMSRSQVVGFKYSHLLITSLTLMLTHQMFWRGLRIRLFHSEVASLKKLRAIQICKLLLLNLYIVTSVEWVNFLFSCGKNLSYFRKFLYEGFIYEYDYRYCFIDLVIASLKFNRHVLVL